MVFSSPIFLFGFLPIVLLASMLVGRSAQNVILLASSLFFYAWGEPVFVLLLLLSIGVNFGLARNIFDAPNRREVLLGLGVGFNLLLLALFKYGVFFLTDVMDLLGASGEWRAGLAAQWPEMPIGISFYTFQAVSYLVDVSRGRCRPQRSLLDLGLYISMFPQLIAGPIVRYSEIEEQLADRKRSWTDFNVGASRFVRGLAKKVLIADTLSIYADAAFGASPEALGVQAAWLGLTCYAFQLYYDFSGYSDMAIGMGRMFGFRFPENFDFPYASQSVREFWKRWHMTLSRWFRDYLYIPLGGNRRSPARVGLNLLFVFALCGLWHGASWGFILWGLYHGCFLLSERLPWGGLFLKIPRFFRHAYLLGVVWIGWVFFRCETLEHAARYLRSMFWALDEEPSTRFESMPLGKDTWLALLIAVFFSTRYPEAIWNRLASSKFAWFSPYLSQTSVLILLVLCMTAIASSTYSPFLYFRF